EPEGGGAGGGGTAVGSGVGAFGSGVGVGAWAEISTYTWAPKHSPSCSQIRQSLWYRPAASGAVMSTDTSTVSSGSTASIATEVTPAIASPATCRNSISSGQGQLPVLLSR